MADDATPRYRFVSRACPEAGFQVVRFEGREELGRCYQFRIELASARQDLDLNALVGGRATFTILRRARAGRPDLPFHGVLLAFRQLHRASAHTFYEAILVPRLHLLSLTRHNQVFLDQTLPECVAACLKDGGLEAGDFRFALAREAAAWEKWDYLCQYGESHLDFVHRRLEREGLYYFFEQGEGEERVVITDSRIVHRARPGEPPLRYHAASGLGGGHQDEVVLEFGCRRRLAPRAVVMRDVDHLAPSIEIRGEAPASPHGHGTSASFGEHLRSPQEGARLAGLRAEEARCGELRFEGRGQVPALQPGYGFRLQGHDRAEWDGDYLAIEVRHRGGAAGFLLAGAGRDLADGDREPGYENQFTALPAAVQFRPPLTTARPRIHGLLAATVDAEGDSVHMDAWSRYKIRLPFDRSGRGAGKASAWVRMLGPYAGAGHGWNSPLHKGAEVLLCFVDGDPDRPVIAGAVPNPRTPSPVNSDNASQVALQTAGKSRLVFETRPGLESIQFECPAKKVFWHFSKWGVDLSVEASWAPAVGTSKELILGNENCLVGLLASAVYAGAAGFAYFISYRHFSKGRNRSIERPDLLQVSNERRHLKKLDREMSMTLNDMNNKANIIEKSVIKFANSKDLIHDALTEIDDMQIIESEISSANEKLQQNFNEISNENSKMMENLVVSIEQVSQKHIENYKELYSVVQFYFGEIDKLFENIQGDYELAKSKTEMGQNKTSLAAEDSTV